MSQGQQNQVISYEYCIGDCSINTHLGMFIFFFPFKKCTLYHSNNITVGLLLSDCGEMSPAFVWTSPGSFCCQERVTFVVMSPDVFHKIDNLFRNRSLSWIELTTY